MAQLPRTAKSGSDWTANELAAYNITFVPWNKQEFGTIVFPDPAELSLAGLMTAETRQDAADKKTRQLLRYLDLAMDPKVGQDAAVDNFAADLLRGLDYDNENRIVFIRHAIPFLICGGNSVAQIDVCTIDDNDVLLLLQKDKTLTSMKDPEPQVVAGAIAAFALNNRKREREIHLPLCNSIMFPCLTMVGTSPIFYKITVTALSKAVQTGSFPEIETRVLRYIPVLSRRNSGGMRPLPNRLEILRCLEVFKKFLRIYSKTGGDEQAMRSWNEDESVCKIFLEKICGGIILREIRTAECAQVIRFSAV
ncbi:hypothetical protein V8E52_010336 [Russula decolorans]